jgi:hypothetical protein
MMTDEPRWPFVIPKALAQEIRAAHVRMIAGLVTAAEIDAIEESLREVPGFSAWEARQMLDRALRKKAFV